MPQSLDMSNLFDYLPDLDADEIIHALDQYIQFRNDCRDLVKLPKGVNPENLIHVLAVVVSCRQQGVNPDLTTISRETGLSRATLRRIHEAWIEGRPDRYALVQDGRRTVLDDTNPLAPTPSQLIRIVTKYFGGLTVQ